MKNRKVYVTTFCGVAVAMNIVLGIITSALGIPLYLDTLGLQVLRLALSARQLEHQSESMYMVD